MGVVLEGPPGMFVNPTAVEGVVFTVTPQLQPVAVVLARKQPDA
jgi:hypothetical protein